MPTITRGLIAALLLGASIGVAVAQPQDGNTSTAANPSPTDPSATDPNPAGQSQAGQSQAGQSQASPDAGNADHSSPQAQSNSETAPGSLSHELNRSGGVIRPPPTHDSGVVSPPNQGVSRTPVIPPPGSPGGNPAIQPK